MRRVVAAAVVALLVTGVTACGGGGGEAEQSPDARDESAEDEGGAPGEDPDGSDDGENSDDSDDEGGAPGEDSDGGGGSTEEAEAGAQSTYVAYQQMFERLAITPDSDDPEIEELTSGEELNHVVDVLTRYETNGQAVEFGARHEHNVFDAAVDGDTATVSDCFVSDARVVDESTRNIVSGDPEGGAASVVTATLVRGDDGWRVDRVTAVAVAPPEGCGPEGIIRRGT